MSIISIINEEIQNLAEELNRISMQTAVDKHMFGPVYHGTTTENRENIEREGFKIFMGSERSENIRNGYITNRDYAQGTPPPIHHLGYGVYFTTVKVIGSRFNQDSTKGLKTHYLDVPRLQTINFASPKRMMEWWIQNGYDASLAKQGQQGRIDATKKMTETLMKNYDAVWFKGKTMYRVLDGDQIVVFDTSKIYQIDPALAGEFEIGSKVRRTSDKFDYQYSYSTTSGESRTLRTIPTIAKGTIGIILAKRPTEEILKNWQNSNQDPSTAWFKDSKYIYKVKWNKGGTEANALDKDLEPLKQSVKQPAEVNEEMRINNIQKINDIQEAIIAELQDLLQEGVADNTTSMPKIIQLINNYEIAEKKANDFAFSGENQANNSKWNGTLGNAMSSRAGVEYQEYMKNQPRAEELQAKARELQQNAQVLADEIRKDYQWLRKSVQGRGMKQYASLSDMINFFKAKYQSNINEDNENGSIDNSNETGKIDNGNETGSIAEIVREEIDDFINNPAQKIADNLTKEPRPSIKNYILANVNMDLAEEAFKNGMSDYYIGKEDKGLGNRKENISKLIQSGELKYAPIVYIGMGNNNKPYISFTDGRHRFAVLRDLGVKTINLAISPESRKLIPLLQKNNMGETNNFIEGIADKYAERQFNISDPNAEMNAKALSGISPEAQDLSMGEFVGKMRNFDYYDDSDKSNKFVNIYMNPKKLDNFDAGVRAVSHNADGNLFVAQNDYSFYHSEISNAVNDEGKYNIGNGYDVNKNITWYRIADTNKFRYSGTFVNQTRNMTPEIIQKALELLRAKNPDLEFIENSNYKRD